MTNDLRPAIWAHRGASGNFVENTRAAFEGARAEGADWVELDVRLTRDGSLIVHHDSAYSDGRGVWATASTDRPESVLTLQEALVSCAGMGVNIEIKNSPGDLGDASEQGDGAVPHDLEVADAVVEVAVGSGVEVLISSFDEPTLARVRSLSPRLATGFLVFDLNADPTLPERAADAGDAAVHPWDPFVDAAFMERCRNLGLAVNPWTIDAEDRILELSRLGVDAVITNFPQRTRSILGRS
ncbi:MAG: glycerophosphodiester phosphodiesterase [Microthrixaceae bacterium]